MLNDLAELKTFKAIAAAGSLTAAARDLGVTLAVVSKRLASLERRSGVRLVRRTTRVLSLTEEGERLLPDVETALEALGAAEEKIATGKAEPSGILRVTASVSFGRRFVAPVLGKLAMLHPRLDVELVLTDERVDIVRDGFDVAVRIGELEDSTATMHKLADNRRILVAAPAYLAHMERPATPSDLRHHRFLRYERTGQAWRLTSDTGQTVEFASKARLTADSGDVVHEWAVAGHGIMLKSEMDVSDDIRSGRLEGVLPNWHGGNAPIVALTHAGRHGSLKARVFVHALSETLKTA
ncbi:MAG: LysR family transcriptional regulator [Alphaproteobacteria bacterium]|nr:MAG: LysR family transcriptional regulator [Alphaproteobacteria bacterium]